jgi:hypothetical protein
MLAELWFRAQLDTRYVSYMSSSYSPAARNDWPVVTAVLYDAATHNFSLSSDGTEVRPLGLLSLIPAMFCISIDFCMHVFHLLS